MICKEQRMTAPRRIYNVGFQRANAQQTQPIGPRNEFLAGLDVTQTESRRRGEIRAAEDPVVDRVQHIKGARLGLAIKDLRPNPAADDKIESPHDAAEQYQAHHLHGEHPDTEQEGIDSKYGREHQK